MRVLDNLVADRPEQPVAKATGSPCTYDHQVSISGLLDEYLCRVSRNGEQLHRQADIRAGTYRRRAGKSRGA